MINNRKRQQMVDKILHKQTKTKINQTKVGATVKTGMNMAIPRRYTYIVVVTVLFKSATLHTQIHNQDLKCICFLVDILVHCPQFLSNYIHVNKGNNRITELRTILQRESQNS